MNVLVVHAHPEPKSFCSSLKNAAVAALEAQGHSVEVSDLNAMGFDPVSDRRNFTTVADPAYLQIRDEENHAAAVGGFAPDLEAEMLKVLKADLLVYSFPLWWFGMPAILKGWTDRVLAMGRMYGMGKLYEDGIGKGKRAMILTTTGGPGSMYDGYGINPPLRDILNIIEHGIFWFTGYAPLPAFVVHSADRMSDEDRTAALAAAAERFSSLDRQPARVLPSTDQFEGFFFGTDHYDRWLVELSGPGLKALSETLFADLRRRGKLLSAHAAAGGAPRMWLTARDADADAVRNLFQPLPTGIEIEITRLERV